MLLINTQLVNRKMYKCKSVKSHASTVVRMKSLEILKKHGGAELMLNQEKEEHLQWKKLTEFIFPISEQ